MRPKRSCLATGRNDRRAGEFKCAPLWSPYWLYLVGIIALVLSVGLVLQDSPIFFALADAILSLAGLALQGSPIFFALVGAIVGWAAILTRIGYWRWAVSTSIPISVMRSGPFHESVDDTIWYVLQFAPLVVAVVGLLFQPSGPLRGKDRLVVFFMLLFAVVAASTSFTSVSPDVTLPQSELLIFMTLFLVLTFTKRWTSEYILRGDMVLLFVLLVAIQTFGVVAGVIGQPWAFDPDYDRYRGLFSNANYAGMISAFGATLGIYVLRDTRRRAAVLAGIGFLLVGLAMSGSRGSLVALGAAILILIASRSSRRMAIQVALVAGLIAAFAVAALPAILVQISQYFIHDKETDITSGRMAIYNALFARFQESPITGAGYRSAEELDSRGLAGHNIYLSTLTEVGLLGVTVFAVLILCLIAASRSRAGRPLIGVAVAIAVVELTESSIHGWGGPTALPAWLLILAFAAYGRLPQAEEPTRAPASRAERPTPEDLTRSGRTVELDQ